MNSLVLIGEELAQKIFSLRDASKVPGHSNTCRVHAKECDAETNLIMLKPNTSLRLSDESKITVTPYRTPLKNESAEF